MKTRTRQINRARSSYERLEERRLLAGDVRLAVSDGTVFLRGDDAGNRVEVVKTLGENELTVRGVDGTTINGQDSVVLSGRDSRARNGFRVNLGRGDDFIRFEDIEHTEGITRVYGGEGDDSVGFYRATVNDLFIQTFNGDDAISIDKLISGGDVRINSLAGDDVIGISGLRAYGDNVIATQSGNDRVSVQFSAIYNEGLSIRTADGNDFVGTETISVADEAYLFTGNGNDQVSVFNTRFLSGTVASGQAGNDQFAIGGRNRSGDTLRAVSFEEALQTPNGKTNSVYRDLIRDGIRLGTISELLEIDPRLSTVAGALSATGFDNRLDDNSSGPEPTTLFAPLDSAFDDLPDGLLESLSTGELRDILRFHISPVTLSESTIAARDEVFTLSNEIINVETVGGDIVLDGDAMFVLTDIRAKNGVIHIVDGVLLAS
ncbi:MAG: fasciclin domain-containing protein [Planctomycetota bacterium]